MINSSIVLLVASAQLVEIVPRGGASRPSCKRCAGTAYARATRKWNTLSRIPRDHRAARPCRKYAIPHSAESDRGVIRPIKTLLFVTTSIPAPRERAPLAGRRVAEVHKRRRLVAKLGLSLLRFGGGLNRSGQFGHASPPRVCSSSADTASMGHPGPDASGEPGRLSPAQPGNGTRSGTYHATAALHDHAGSTRCRTPPNQTEA